MVFPVLYPPISNLLIGLFLLLTNIHCVLQMFSPFLSLSFTKISCSFLSISYINTVLSAYLMSWPPIMNPVSISNSLRIVSLYRLQMSGEKLHPCHELLSIFFLYLLNYSYASGLQPVSVLDPQICRCYLAKN